MLRTLLESKAVHARRTGGTVISIGMHAAIIALAIVATAGATSARPAPQPHKPAGVIYTQPRVAERQRPTERRGGTSRTIWVCQCAVPAVRTPEIRPTLAPLGASPSQIASPSIDWGNGQAGSLSPAEGFQSPRDGIYRPNEVEKAAIPRPGNPAPVYPAALRAAQIDGSVVARFVVDTMGLAEPASIAFPEATHAQFADAVRQSLLRSRYLPAMVGDRRVRQLVEQHFAFTLTR